ncbi:MAG: TetR/AcrR family transcriptional regulator [bacterium]
MRSVQADAGQQKTPTKARILAAAQAVFAEKGFEGASTREIAARAEVNISSLHYHWDSKETLFATILQNVQTQLISKLSDIVGAEPPATPEEARRTIETAMGATFDYFADDLTVPRLLMRRILDGGGTFEETDRIALESSWPTFLDWTRVFTGGKYAPEDATFFLVAIQSVLLVLMLDSPLLLKAVGGRIDDPIARVRLRQRVIKFVEKLLDVGENDA